MIDIRLTSVTSCDFVSMVMIETMRNSTARKCSSYETESWEKEATDLA